MKTIFLSALLFIPLLCMATTHTDTVRTINTKTKTTAKSFWVFSPHITAGTSYFTGNMFAADGEIVPGHYFETGSDIGYMVNPYFGVFTGLSYASYQYGLHKNTAYNTLYVETKQSLGYLEVPLFLRVVTSKAHKTGFFTDAGFCAGTLIATHTTQTITDHITAQKQTDKNNSQEGLNKIATMAFMDMGIKIPIGRKTNLMPCLSYYSFISNVDLSYSNKKNFHGVGLKMSVAIHL